MNPKDNIIASKLLLTCWSSLEPFNLVCCGSKDGNYM